MVGPSREGCGKEPFEASSFADSAVVAAVPTFAASIDRAAPPVAVATVPAVSISSVIGQ